jgi:hypothetical protein
MNMRIAKPRRHRRPMQINPLRPRPRKRQRLSVITDKFDPPVPHRHRRRPWPRTIQCDQIPAMNNQIRTRFHGRES